MLIAVVFMVAGLAPAAHAERDYPWCVFGGELGRSRRMHVFDARTMPGFVIRPVEHLLRHKPAREIPAAAGSAAPNAPNGAIRRPTTSLRWRQAAFVKSHDRSPHAAP